MLAALGAGMLLAIDLGEYVEFVLDSLLVAIAFLGLLVVWVQRSSARWLGHILVAWTAKVSYSLYLTHALVIHAFVLGIFPRPRLREFLALVVAVVLILLTGWIFYFVYERSALVLRERVAPARAG